MIQERSDHACAVAQFGWEYGIIVAGTQWGQSIFEFALKLKTLSEFIESKSKSIMK